LFIRMVSSHLTPNDSWHRKSHCARGQNSTCGNEMNESELGFGNERLGSRAENEFHCFADLRTRSSVTGASRKTPRGCAARPTASWAGICCRGGGGSP